MFQTQAAMDLASLCRTAQSGNAATTHQQQFLKDQIMTIEKVTTPYEFLIRWKDGLITGAHVKFLEQLKEDGAVLTEKEGQAIPVSLAGESGYPVDDVFAAISTGAVAVAQKAILDIADSNAKKAEAEALAAKEIEDAKARELAANEAKAAAEAAEAAAKLAADAAEAENKRLADALAVAAEAERVAKEKAAFDAAVAAAVAAQLSIQNPEINTNSAV